MFVRSGERSTILQPSSTIQIVEIIAASTIYGLFSSFLLFPYLGLPRRLQWAAMTLLISELVALGLYSYWSLEAGRALATLDLPLLSAALVLLGMMRAVRVSE
jgi:hypothetical protein